MFSGLTSSGKEFIIGFLKNHQSFQTNLQLFFTTNCTNANITVSTPLFNSFFILKLSVQKGHSKNVKLDPFLEGSVMRVENKGVHVVADEEIVVYALNSLPPGGSTGVYLVFPSTVLGIEYFVISWSEKSSFMIVASHDDTHVIIKFGKGSPSVTLLGYMLGYGKSITVYLNRFETFFVHSLIGDFTGTYVKANKPIAVVGGSACARIGQGACDHLVQRLIPVDKWEKDFVTVSMPGCGAQDRFRIVTSANDTTVYISGLAPFALTNSGDFYQFTLNNDQSKSISANKPIQLILFAQGQCDHLNRGDPVMSLVPAIQQFSSDYTFSTLSISAIHFRYYITLVISDNFINGLRFNGFPLSTITWKTVEGRMHMKYTEFSISTGVKYISHIDPTVKFMAFVSGLATNISNSYGFAAGFDFRNNGLVSVYDKLNQISRNKQLNMIHPYVIIDHQILNIFIKTSKVFCLNAMALNFNEKEE